MWKTSKAYKQLIDFNSESDDGYEPSDAESNTSASARASQVPAITKHAKKSRHVNWGVVTLKRQPHSRLCECRKCAPRHPENIDDLRAAWCRRRAQLAVASRPVFRASSPYIKDSQELSARKTRFQAAREQIKNNPYDTDDLNSEVDTGLEIWGGNEPDKLSTPPEIPTPPQDEEFLKAPASTPEPDPEPEEGKPMPPKIHSPSPIRKRFVPLLSAQEGAMEYLASAGFLALTEMDRRVEKSTDHLHAYSDQPSSTPQIGCPAITRRQMASILEEVTYPISNSSHPNNAYASLDKCDYGQPKKFNEDTVIGLGLFDCSKIPDAEYWIQQVQERVYANEDEYDYLREDLNAYPEVGLEDEELVRDIRRASKRPRGASFAELSTSDPRYNDSPADDLQSWQEQFDAQQELPTENLEDAAKLMELLFGHVAALPRRTPGLSPTTDNIVELPNKRRQTKDWEFEMEPYHDSDDDEEDGFMQVPGALGPRGRRVALDALRISGLRDDEKAAEKAQKIKNIELEENDEKEKGNEVARPAKENTKIDVKKPASEKGILQAVSNSIRNLFR